MPLSKLKKLKVYQQTKALATKSSTVGGENWSDESFLFDVSRLFGKLKTLCGEFIDAVLSGLLALLLIKSPNNRWIETTTLCRH